MVMFMNSHTLFSPNFGMITVTSLHNEDTISTFINFSNDLSSPYTYFCLCFLMDQGYSQC